MIPETLIKGSSLDQLLAINDLRDSLQLSYSEVESVASQYGITNPRIFPYLGSDSSPPHVEKYSNTVLKTLEPPIGEDYVRIALNILATPIREDYLRLAMNNVTRSIREDHLRLAMNNVTRSIREDHLRLVLQALMRAIREDCLRTALVKFKDNGIEAKPAVTQVTGVIQGNTEFIKYSPANTFNLMGEEKFRYIELKELGSDRGDIVTVLDMEMYEIPVNVSPEMDGVDFSLYTNGSIGMDGVYVDKEFNMESVKHIYMPVYCEFSPTKEKVPRDFWITQVRDILDERGWNKSNIKDISRESFRTYKGKKPSNKVMCRMRHSLLKEMETRKAQ